jgi:NitT/TauT family transport system ATP-binding protein
MGRVLPFTGQEADPGVLLDVDDVTLQYKTDSRLVTATYKVDFQVHRGDRFVLLGPSGCGKSSLLKAVAGFIKPVEGSIRLNGTPVVGPGPDRMVVFQEFDQLLPWKTVLQNVLFPLRSRGVPKREAEDRARNYIAKVGLDRFRDSYPHTLSGGMKQRVAIARALSYDPEILLLDEPFGALDAMTRDKMNIELQRIAEATQATVVLVTHSIGEAVFLADRVVLLSARPGQIRSITRVEAPRPRELDVTAEPDFQAKVLDLRRQLIQDEERLQAQGVSE